MENSVIKIFDDSFPGPVTVKKIAELAKRDLDINKGDFNREAIIGTTLSRLSGNNKNPSKLDEDQCDYIFDYLHMKSGGTSESFGGIMKKWFPNHLKNYTKEAEIRKILKWYMLNEGDSNRDKNDIPIRFDDNKDFLAYCLESDVPVECVKMIAVSGWHWLDNEEKTKLLIHLADHQIPFYFIANPESKTMQKIMETMQDPEKELRYPGFNRNLDNWHKYELKYDTIQLRISDYPILQHSLLVEYEDGTAKGIIRDYTYGLPVNDATPFRMVEREDPYYKYYDAEFNYLWENGKTYESWIDFLPKPDEELKPGKYVLIYDDCGKTDCVCWTYAALSIGKNNRVSLKSDITNPMDEAEWNQANREQYEGNAKVTRNNIFITLQDNVIQEQMSVSFARPLHANNRFIGIMSRLSPSGHELKAFKCVCIEQSLLSKVNEQSLDLLLRNRKMNSNSNMVKVEESDINLFYSENVLFNQSSE